MKFDLKSKTEDLDEAKDSLREKDRNLKDVKETLNR